MDKVYAEPDKRKVMFCDPENITITGSDDEDDVERWKKYAQ